jgi:Fic family protein
MEDKQVGIDPVLRAAVAHLWFVTIHPFVDGNGRIARAIGDLLLARSENTAADHFEQAGRRDYCSSPHASTASRRKSTQTGKHITISSSARKKTDSTSHLNLTGFSNVCCVPFKRPIEL